MKKSLLITLFAVVLTQNVGAMQQQGGLSVDQAADEKYDTACLSDFFQFLCDPKNDDNLYNGNEHNVLYAIIISDLPSADRLSLIQLWMKCGHNSRKPYRKGDETIYSKVKRLAGKRTTGYYRKVLNVLDK